MRDSVPSARYSSVCNVLRQWRIWLIPTHRVYRLYDNNSNNDNTQLESATALGKRRRVLHRRLCTAQLHSAGYICVLQVDVIVLNLNEVVTFAQCTWALWDQIDVRLNIYI